MINDIDDCIEITELNTTENVTLDFTLNMRCVESLPGWRDRFGSGIASTEKVIMVALCAPLIFIGLIMNIFIIVVILKNSLQKKPMFVFILILAISDVIMLVLNTPIGLHYLMFNNWIFGKALCHILMPIFTLPVYVSSWTITLISVERYKATHVTNNHSTPMARNKSVLMIMVVLFFSIMLAIPLMMYTKYQRSSDLLPGLIKFKRDMAWCMEKWPGKQDKAMYGIIIMATLFILPTILTVTLHILIYIVLNKRLEISRRSTTQHASRHTLGNSAAEIRARKTCKKNRTAAQTLFSIVLVFILCWSPLSIFLIILDIRPSIIPTDKVAKINIYLKLVAICSSCINPIFYGWLNRAFRKEASQLMETCKWPRCVQNILKTGTLADKTTGVELETVPRQMAENFGEQTQMSANQMTTNQSEVETNGQETRNSNQMEDVPLLQNQKLKPEKQDSTHSTPLHN